MKKAIKTVGWCLLALFVIYTFFFLWKQSQPAPVVYELVKPVKRDIVKKIVETGDLEARNQVELKPQVNGIVTDILVKPGEAVKVGDVVAVVKVIPDMSALNQTQGELNASTLDFEQKQREFDRTEALYKKGVVSREEYEQSKTLLDIAREKVNTAKSQIEVITKGASSRSGSVNTTKIVSTMDGIVLAVPVKEGTAVSATSMFSEGSTVVKIANMQDVIFKGKIDETEVAKLSVGMNMTLVLGAMQNEKISATLEYVSPEAVSSNGAKMFEIHASVHIPAGLNILNGYSVNANIELEKASQALSIDETAVEIDNGKTYVYKLTSPVEDTEDQTFERIAIEAGISDCIHIEVKDGITENMMLRGIKK